jgi:hypothetical protein
MRKPIFYALISILILNTCGSSSRVEQKTSETQTDINTRPHQIIQYSENKLEFPKTIKIDTIRALKFVYGNSKNIGFTPGAIINYNKFNNKVYVCNPYYGTILVFDKDLNYLEKFSEYGDGMGEFIAPTFINFDKKGRMIITDNELSRAQLFNNDFHYIETFPVNPLSRMVVSDYSAKLDNKERVITFDPNQERLFAVYDFQKNLIKEIGKPFPVNQRYWSYNELLYDIDDKGYIYSAFIFHPVIRKYDYNGRLIFEADLSNFPVIKRLLDRRNFMATWKNEEKPDSFWGLTLISGLSVSKKHLHLFSHENKSLIYVLDKSDMKIVKMYQLYSEENEPIFISHFDMSADDYFYVVIDNYIAKFPK